MLQHNISKKNSLLPAYLVYDDECQLTLRQKEKLYSVQSKADRDALKYAKTPSMYGYI
jgi:hypothetical protein